GRSERDIPRHIWRDLSEVRLEGTSSETLEVRSCAVPRGEALREHPQTQSERCQRADPHEPREHTPVDRGDVRHPYRCGSKSEEEYEAVDCPHIKRRHVQDPGDRGCLRGFVRLWNWFAGQ